MKTDVVPERSAGVSYDSRSCPSCGQRSTGGTVKANVPAETRSFDVLASSWYGFFKEKVYFTFARCLNCSLLYCPQYFTQDQLAELYASMPANMELASFDALDRTQQGYFDALAARSPLTGQFLEIGPDVGTFAKFCAAGGSFEKFWMFEPNVDAHAKLRSNVGAKPIEISTALLDLSVVPDRSISAAAMIHVLDHLTDPVGFLRALRPKLAPGAVVLIVTHDERSLLARAIGNRFPAYCLQHPQLFNRKTIRTLLGKAGFQLDKTISSKNYFPIPFLIEQLALVLGFELKIPFGRDAIVAMRLGNFISLASATK